MDLLYPYRNHSLSVLREHLPDLTPAQLDWAPAGGRNSIGWLLRHIYESEDYWVHRRAYGEPVARPVAGEGARALLAEYERVRQATDARLAACTPVELARVVAVPAFSDGWKPPCVPTVHWVFHHVFEHENYHIGQISQLLRLQGLKPLPF